LEEIWHPMVPPRRRTCGLVVAVSLLAVAGSAWSAEESVDFGMQVLPLLRQKCFRCHEGREAKSGVRLDQRSQLLDNIDRGPLVVVGKSSESRLFEVTSGADPSLRMPPRGDPPLKPAEIALLD
jgi:hypothetical protein